MAVLSWLNKLRPTLTDGKFWLHWFGGNTWTGKPVTADTALNFSTWFRCVKLYHDVTASMSLKLYERLPQNDRRLVEDDGNATKRVIELEPNADLTTWEFWGAHGAALAMFGNATAEKRFVGDRLVALDPLPPTTVPFRTADNALRYRFYDRGKLMELPADKVFHSKSFSFGGDFGLSPLAYARQSLGIALATEEAAGRTFANGMRASGIFSGPAKMNPAQEKEFRKNYVEPAEGVENEGKSLVLPPEFKWHAISIPSKEAEMLLNRRFNVEDVARWMAVPPILAGHAAEGQTMWGSGVENIVLAWLTLGLDGFLCCIERSINKRIVPVKDRGRFFAEFDRNALLRADSQARADFIMKMVGAAQMTPNEARRKENRPPIEGGDQGFINSTYVPISQAGRARIQPAPGEPIP